MGYDTFSSAGEGISYVAPRHGQVRAVQYLRGFKPLVHTLGGNFRRILEDHEIDEIALENQDFPLNYMTATTMLENCVMSLDDNLFGIHLAERQDPYVFGCLTSVARSAATFGAGLEAFAKFLPVFHSPGADPAVVVGSEVAEFRWHQNAFGHGEQATLHGLMLALKFLRELYGRDFSPKYVMSASDIRSRTLAEIESKFGCRVLAKSPASVIAFPVSLLDQPLATADAISFDLLHGFLSNLKRTNTATIVDQVKAHVGWSSSPPGVWTMKRCAAKLGMSSRALQKRLHGSGVQFSDLVEERRIETAKRALLETDYTLDEIANHLGYSEQSSFGRAFKRWTGVTPQGFRDRRGDA